MSSKTVDEDIREIIRLLSNEDKRKVLEFIDAEEDLKGIVDRLEGRGMTFVRQAFLGFEELDLVEKQDQDYSTARKTNKGRELLDIRQEFDEDYHEAVQRFFENSYSLEDADHIHEIIEFRDGDLEIDVPGLPEEFVRMEDMFDLFYELQLDQRLEDLSERFDITEPSVRKRIRSLERHGLVNEKKQGRHEKAFFYGPFAHPVLKMASKIEEIYQDKGVDWRWIEEEDDPIEPDFVDYSNWNPDQTSTKKESGSLDRSYFEVYNGIGEESLIQEIERVETLEQMNERLSTIDMSLNEVSAVNNDNVVLKGGYIWDNYTNQDIQEGDYLVIREKDVRNTGFEEVEALARINPEDENFPL